MWMKCEGIRCKKLYKVVRTVRERNGERKLKKRGSINLLKEGKRRK
jgi:hypothetical protein